MPDTIIARNAPALQHGCLGCGWRYVAATDGRPDPFCAVCAPTPYQPIIAHQNPVGGLRFTITSESTPTKKYRVDLSGVRPVCSCPAFTFGGDCKHLGHVAVAAPILEAALIAREATERAARRAARQIPVAAADLFGRATL